MSDAPSSSASRSAADRLRRPVQIVIVSSVMFTFISYWRTAAVVLCDLASTAYYIGGIVEGAIGPAAPWFILAVMLFSAVISLIYIESCSLFVRGGVYRVVKEAMGGLLAKLSVSALLFDYILTGPISATSAGQYLMGLFLEGVKLINPGLAIAPSTADTIRCWGSVVVACAVILYFLRQNLLGIHESSGKAMKIMAATTIMGVVMFAWCGATLFVRGPSNAMVYAPDLQPKVEYQVVHARDRITGEERAMWQRDPSTGKIVAEKIKRPDGTLCDRPKRNEATGRQEDPLGLIGRIAPSFAERLRQPGNWLSVVGLIGILLAFGHSILAMSGEETLAQVYREVESPKLPNFKKAALVVFLYSLGFTVTICFLAVAIIPNEVRMHSYADNLIGGLAMYVLGPLWLRLTLNAFVVVVGFLILSGAVNTAIIGANGVMNRVAEDGVVPDSFLKPHRRYGTTYRVLWLIAGMQLLTVLLSRGDMYVLGEAYAFGVVWSFVFKALAMIVLRFKDRSPREFKVPLNVRIGGVEWPIGLMAVFLVLLMTALLNLFTKEVATVGGCAFTAVFTTIFILSERYHARRRGGAEHQHVEQFNQRETGLLSPTALDMAKPYRKLVAIRSTQNLRMLEKCLAETDPDTTDVAVMTAQMTPRGESPQSAAELDHYNRELMTSVVDRAERAGKHVQPLVVRTNNPLFAVVQTARDLDAHELILGASNVYTADEQMEQIAFYWIDLCAGIMRPLTVRLIGPARDVYFDLAGGHRVPKIGERQARSVDELRAAGVGVDHVLLVHDNTSAGSDLFAAALTMLDEKVALSVACRPSTESVGDARNWLDEDLERAGQLHRDVVFCALPDAGVNAIADLAKQIECDLIVVGLGDAPPEKGPIVVAESQTLVRAAPCPVCFIVAPPVPDRVEG